MAALTTALKAADNGVFTVGNQTAGYGKFTLVENTKADGTSAVDAETQKKLSTQAGFQSLIRLENTAAKGGTKITLNSAHLAEGDTLTIGGKEYTFTNDAGKAGQAGYVQIGKDGKETLFNLKDKLAGNNMDSMVSADGTSLTISASADGKNPEVLGKGMYLQIGDTSDDFNQLNVKVSDMHTDALGIADITVANQDGAAAAIQKIKDAINSVSSTRGDLGAIQNRLEHTQNNLSVMTENIQDAEATIRDTDVADEMMAYTKNNILIQSAQAMLAQANQVPQGVLQLLQ